MIVQICSQASRNSAYKLTISRFCVFAFPKLPPTYLGPTFAGSHPLPRKYSRTAPVEAATADTSRTSPSSKASSSSESTVGNGTEVPKVKTVRIVFVESDDRKKTVRAEIGKHLLDVAHSNNVDLEGACGGELSCSTCHLIFEPRIYAKLPPKTDEEQDMLDLAHAVTETYVLSFLVFL
jgi:ferredoxin-2, mitochondrial